MNHVRRYNWHLWRNWRLQWLSFALTAIAAASSAAIAQDDLEANFDRAFTAPAPAPPLAPLPSGRYGEAPYSGPFSSEITPQSPLASRLAALAEPTRGRIGVAALDLTTGRAVAVLGSEPFPLASTGKLAIVATFLEGVDQGRFRLSDPYPLMIPLPSQKFSGGEAPERPGASLPAEELIELALTRSDNHATDALLRAIGGPQAVDLWLRRAGIAGMHLDRTIGTLVRDDGEINPAVTVDPRDSTTPEAMVRLLAGLWQGNWLSAGSRSVLLGAMSRCQTGVHRLRAGIPDEALVGHKTGTLANTSSDVGLIRTPEGHTVALAIYVTGQGSRPGREERIAEIARAVYQGYQGQGYQGSSTAPGYSPGPGFINRTASR